MGICELHGEEKVKSRCRKCRADYMREYVKRRTATDPVFAERQREASRRWAALNPEKRKRADLECRLRSRGISEEQYAALDASQGSRCAICGARCKLDIDHCHDTNVVRGLLCRKCNLGVGLLDSPEKLRAAESYMLNPPFQNLLRSKT